MDGIIKSNLDLLIIFNALSAVFLALGNWVYRSGLKENVKSYYTVFSAFIICIYLLFTGIFCVLNLYYGRFAPAFAFGVFLVSPFVLPELADYRRRFICLNMQVFILLISLFFGVYIK